MLTRQALRRAMTAGFTYWGLTYYSGGVIAALQAASGDVARTVAGETNLSSTVAQSVILAGLLVAVAREPARYARMCRPLLPVLCIAALASASTLWSVDPVRTMRRAVALGECLLFGMFLHRTAGLERTIGRIARVCVAMAVLSLLAYVAVPSIGRETALGYERALRGVFPQKNSMSECMLLGLCCLAASRRGGIGRHWASVALLTGCLVLGRGASALAVAAIVALMVTWTALARWPVLRLGVGFGLAWCGAVAVAALVVFPGEVLALMGRDLSLTGRVPLWQAVLPEIARAPLLGHGYAGFWNADRPAVQMIWRYAGWSAPDAHSSYLDILLQLGAVGLALFVWAWAVLGRRIAAARRTGYAPARFATIYGVALLLIGLDEGAIPIPGLWMALLPLTLLALSRHLALVRALSRPDRAAAAPIRPVLTRAA